MSERKGRWKSSDSHTHTHQHADHTSVFSLPKNCDSLSGRLPLACIAGRRTRQLLPFLTRSFIHSPSSSLLLHACQLESLLCERLQQQNTDRAAPSSPSSSSLPHPTSHSLLFHHLCNSSNITTSPLFPELLQVWSRTAVTSAVQRQGRRRGQG